jgi:hypothetical protein
MPKPRFGQQRRIGRGDLNMSCWIPNPVWQNFSSLFREAITAQEAKTGMEKSHHLTASLYFGIAALEAFLNDKMRVHLDETRSEEEILDVLRKGQIISKLKRWPVELLGKSVNVNDATLDLITLINDIRGDLTHPKTHGHDLYAKLETIDPLSVIESVAEYIVRFHEAEGTRFPYWLFGWNYLNPRPNSYEIFIINDQQFCFSLRALGFQVPVTEEWLDQNLGTFEGYVAVKQTLDSLDHCEPKLGIFPFKPVLCRRWWTSQHQRSCGHVSDDELNRVRRYVVREQKEGVGSRLA